MVSLGFDHLMSDLTGAEREDQQSRLFSPHKHPLGRCLQPARAMTSHVRLCQGKSPLGCSSAAESGNKEGGVHVVHLGLFTHNIETDG